MMSTNLTSAYRLTQLAHPLLKAVGGGASVLFNSSVAGGPLSMRCARATAGGPASSPRRWSTLRQSRRRPCQAACAGAPRRGRAQEGGVASDCARAVAARPNSCCCCCRSGSVYAMTKASLNQLAKNLACEWAADGVRVNSVAPWYISTDLANQVRTGRLTAHLVAAAQLLWGRCAQHDSCSLQKERGACAVLL